MSESDNAMLEMLTKAIADEQRVSVELADMRTMHQLKCAECDSLQAQLKAKDESLVAERAARAEADKRVTALTEEVRRPVVQESKKEPPPSYEMVVAARDINDKVQKMMLVPVKTEGA